MSAYVREPEPRGNRSDACEILTQNRLLQNETLSGMTSLYTFCSEVLFNILTVFKYI